MPRKKKKEVYKVNTNVVLAVIALIIALLILFLLFKKLEKPNVIATVNNEAITEQDLNFILKFFPSAQRQSISRQTLLDQAIAIKLVNQEAVKRGIEVKDEEIEAIIKNSLRQFNTSEQEFEKLLEEQGITLQEFKEIQKQQIVTAKLINQTVMENVNITDKEVSDFYEQYKTQINATFDEIKDELKTALIIQRANNAFLLYLQQLRVAADIKIVENTS